MFDSSDPWRLAFHLMPPQGWMNDPNGLCQYEGTYHVFFQYAPSFPAAGEHVWGHYASQDLLSWRFLGTALHADKPFDRDGVYSGCAVVDGGAMHLLYTGNVKHHGDYDYTSAGREANQVHVISRDGVEMGEKRVVLTNESYPASCSCHVRDPKVWREDGRWLMLLGMRDREDSGAVLLFESPDLDTWHYVRTIGSTEPFGYMWECPDRIEIGDHEFLGCCPQGLPSEERRWQNVYQSGYFPVEGRVSETGPVDPAAFREWDMGFDFYAPQTFTDDRGRTLLIGWMGLPDLDGHYENPTPGWEHCLTVPRELSRGTDGGICQWPAAELEGLRGASHDLSSGGVMFENGIADVAVEGISLQTGEIALGHDLRLSFADGVTTLELLGEAGAGRTVRIAETGPVESLRMLVDTSAVEVFVNGGATAFATRWYPAEKHLEVSARLDAARAVAWDLVPRPVTE